MKLIRKTKSLCPVCLNKISADIMEVEGKIYIKKKCKIHGEFEDIYYGHSDMYYKFMEFFKEEEPVSISLNEDEKNCPDSCGICENHKSSTVLANIDITNACNFQCPICFAHSMNNDHFYNPSIEEISNMMDLLRNTEPPCDLLQLSGGEPTLRKDFFEIAKMAREKGFVQLQLATNGKILAEDSDFVKNLVKYDFDTIYLQFDGVTPEPYITLRGFNALPIKIKAIENVRKMGTRPNFVLVPTIVKGINDHQIGDIIRFASENMDIVRGINFQPISYTGRIKNEELMNRRFTIADLLASVHEQLNGEISPDDFLPITAASPVLEFLELMSKDTQYPKLSTHPICGVWTLAYKFGKKFVPLNRIIKFRELSEFLGSLKSVSKNDVTKKIVTKLHKFVYLKNSYYAFRMLMSLKNLLTKRDIYATSDFMNNKNVLFIGTMHFMDPYNFDFERLERCCIHYATPDNRIVPFCSYNIFYRETLEKKFAKKKQ